MLNNYGRRQSAMKTMCLSGEGISSAWGVRECSVKMALAKLSQHGRCSCGARFHMREQ